MSTETDVRRTFPNHTWTVGKLVLTVARQSAGAPIIDGCNTWSVDGWEATGWAIRLPRGAGSALIVAWRGWKGHDQLRFIRCVVRVPVVGRLFKGRWT